MSVGSLIAALLAILHFGKGLAFAGKWRAHRELAFIADMTNFWDVTSSIPKLRDGRKIILLGLQWCINCLHNVWNEDDDSHMTLQRLTKLEGIIANFVLNYLANGGNIQNEMSNVVLSLDIIVQLKTMAIEATGINLR